MVFLPVGATRVPDQLSQTLNQASILRRQQALSRTANELSTGRRINLPSDDPAGSVQVSVLQGLRERQEQFLTNVEHGATALSSLETTLRNMADVIDSAKAIAVRGGQNVLGEAERQGALVEVEAIIDNLLSIANKEFVGRPELAGQQIATPFVKDAGGVVFTGNNGLLQTLASLDETLALNITPNSSIGTDSTAGHGTDLDPDINAATRLAELNGGAGVARGTITVNVGAGDVLVDLTSADSIGDVINAIDAAVGAGTASLNGTGNGLQLTGVGPITVRDTAGGSTARDLGILGESVAAPLVGLDLDPELRLTTPVSLLRSGAGIDLTSGLQITNGPYSATVDLTGSTTVEEVLNRINAAGVRVRAEINAERTGINVVSVLSGAAFSITETGLAGTTAADLGIRTTTLDTLLDDFQGRAGVHTIDGVDIRITTHAGGSFDVDLSAARTVRDVKDLIETATGGAVLVDENPLGGIRLTDTTAGAGNFAVLELNGSPAADDLGIAADVGAASTILGTDKHQARVEGLFDSLLRLRNGLMNNDTDEVRLAGAQLQQDSERVLSATGSLGARLQVLDITANRLRDESARLERDTSLVLDADFTETVTELVNRQTALQAALAASARLLQNSLLDFL